MAVLMGGAELGIKPEFGHIHPKYDKKVRCEGLEPPRMPKAGKAVADYPLQAIQL
jgi:hypothetical protein